MRNRTFMYSTIYNQLKITFCVIIIKKYDKTKTLVHWVLTIVYKNIYNRNNNIIIISVMTEKSNYALFIQRASGWCKLVENAQ